MKTDIRLDCSNVSKDNELEQLRYAFHKRDIDVIREKNEESDSLQAKLKDRTKPGMDEDEITGHSISVV